MANPRSRLSPSVDRPHQAKSVVELLERLHQTSPVFRDESLAPRIDHAILRRLVRGELDETAARQVFSWIHSFRGWREAYKAILIAEFRYADDETGSQRLEAE
jgi:hypothetical protein